MNFRKSLIGIAGAIVAFGGAAFGQTTCTGVSSSTSFIRAEGQTELLPPLTIACSGASSTSTATVTVFVSPTVQITSKSLGSGGFSEAVIQINGNGNGIAGTVAGSSVIFANVPLSTATTSLVVSNIRVNASTLPSTVGSLSVGLTETVVLTGTNTNNFTATTSSPVAYALNGLGAVKLNNGGPGGTTTSITSLSVCAGQGAQSGSGTTATPNPYFTINVSEGIPTAFKTQASEQSQVGIPGQTIPSTAIVTTSAPGTGTINTATSGTRLAITFNNVPTGLAIYLPVTVAAQAVAGTATPQLTLVSSGTAPGLNPVPGIIGSSSFSSNGFLPGGAFGPVAQISATGTTATAFYEVTTDNPNILDQYQIPVFYIAGTGTSAVPVQSTALSVTVNLAPVSTSSTPSTVPSFSGSTTSQTTINANTFSACLTSLLFPFITNQAGVFETGIAIANTTLDPSGKTSPQSGTCTLNFYNSAQTSPATNPAAITVGPIAAGSTYLNTLSGAFTTNGGTAPSGGFGGYMIATCQFQDAHGFAYIVYSPSSAGVAGGQLGGNAATTLGYLALVLNRNTNLTSAGAEALQH